MHFVPRDILFQLRLLQQNSTNQNFADFPNISFPEKFEWYFKESYPSVKVTVHHFKKWQLMAIKAPSNLFEMVNGHFKQGNLKINDWTQHQPVKIKSDPAYNFSKLVRKPPWVKIS